MIDTMPSHHRLFATLVAMAVGLSVIMLGPGRSAAQEDRSPPPEVVVLARSDNPADALGAGPVAGILGAPVLVTAQHLLLDVTAEAIEAIDPDVVIIAGGLAALSADVEQAVTNLGYPTRRIAGADRHQTAAMLAALLTEFHTGRPLLSGAPVTDDVIPGLNAEQLGGLTLADVIAETASTPHVLVDHDPRDFDHTGVDGFVTNRLTVALADHCGDGTTIHQVMAEATAVVFFEGPGESVAPLQLLQLRGEEHGGESLEFATRVQLTLPAGVDQDITTLVNKRLFELGPGAHELESAWTPTQNPYRVSGPTLYATVHGWSCGG